MASVLSSSINLHLTNSLKPGRPLKTLTKLPPLQGFGVIPGIPSLVRSARSSKVVMRASQQQGLDVTGPTTMALMAAMIIPEIAEAAQPGVSPSLKNLLLSVLYGGIIATVIGVAVAGVSVFDPVKRK